jgi:hypothetical protein
MRMIKHIKKIPSFHLLQEHVSLFLTVIQLSIIIFVYIPPINAQTKLVPISGPNDWTELIGFLPKAKMAGISIWISLLPPSKTPPICPTCNYSEPYRLDFIHWAKEIANLSLRYSNLTGYTIGDLQNNLTLGYIKQTTIDSMITTGKSINPRLQFITTLPNIYYVGKNATGNGSGSSWANKQIYTSFDWTQVQGGDTVYFDGGTDSVTYTSLTLTSILPTSQVVITNGKDAGHNGKAIFLRSGSWSYGNPFAAFTLAHCQNIKLVNLIFKVITDTPDDNGCVIYFTYGGFAKIDPCNNVIDNCHLISDGNVAGILSIEGETKDTVKNCLIEYLDNTSTYEMDGIGFGFGGGGHTITENTIILRGTGDSPHRDGIQWCCDEGGTNNYETIIANNFICNVFLGSANSGIYLETLGSNRFLIYNNIITLKAVGAIGVWLVGTTPASSYNLSARIFNNTIVVNTYHGIATWFDNLDTLIFKNNLALCDSVGASALYTHSGLGYITYKDIDYNQYYLNGRSIKIDTASGGGSATWAQWKALDGNKYDQHSDTGNTVTFAKLWGTNPTDYKLVSGSAGINQGTDLSAYFTTDILGTSRPQGTAWDMGAF